MMFTYFFFFNRLITCFSKFMEKTMKNSNSYQKSNFYQAASGYAVPESVLDTPQVIKATFFTE